jgi:hypothetical protein
MSLVKCPDCLHLCFSDSQECRSCAREFDRGELSLKLAAENRAFNKKCYGIFLVLFVVLMIAVGYAVFQGPVFAPTRHGTAVSKTEGYERITLVW